MKKILVFLTCFSIFQTQAQSLTQVYTPTADNVKTRTSFQDRKFGMFIHWGASSVLGDGEWVMENHGIQVNDYKKLIKSCDIGLSTVIIKKSLIKNLRFPNLKTKEDYVLWLEIAKKGKTIHALNTKLTQWRKSKNSLSSSVVRKLTDGYYVYRHHLKFSVIKSLYSLLVLSINFLNKSK